MELIFDSASETRAKARRYALLAEVFSSYPTQEGLKEIRQVASALGISCFPDFSLAELEREYMELFIVPNPRYTSPYESIFRGRWIWSFFQDAKTDPIGIRHRSKTLAMEETAREVRRYYIKMGLFPDTELPDHIANELSFMAFLWLREAEASSEKIREISEFREMFCKKHLLEWVGLLRKKVMENEHLGFYGMVLQMVEVLLRGEIERGIQGYD